MAQIKIYGIEETLSSIRQQLSDVVHWCVVDALALPVEKRFHRFFPMNAENFLFPPDRSSRYTIIEISMFEGRSVAVKKKLLDLLFERLQSRVGIAPNDLEITITETPRHNWGIRGQPGDELALKYSVEPART